MVKTVEDIHNFLDKLASKADLYVPLTKEGIASFEKLGESLFDLESYKNSVLPITKHLFPETETLYSYKWEDGYQLSQTTPDKEKKIFFGARPCDCAGLERLDRVFGSDYKDLLYITRRKNTTIIGLACNEPAYHSCFCTSLNLTAASGRLNLSAALAAAPARFSALPAIVLLLNTQAQLRKER